MPEKLSLDLVELKKDDVLQEVKKRLERGEEPLRILDYCRQGMAIVGDKYQAGEYFLAELILSSEIFKSAVSLLGPYISKSREPGRLGKIVIATLRGDIHDLGKDLFATLLDTQGFLVYNLGKDVDPKIVVEKVKEVKPDFVGFSALMTTGFEVMKKTAKMLEDAGLREGIKLMIGGGVTTPAAAKHIGADFQTVDAMEGVNYCKEIVGGK